MDAFALTPPRTAPVTAPVMPPVIAPTLVQWQAQHGRNHLPWQATRDPYRVWLSEIMLQQTQVASPCWATTSGFCSASRMWPVWPLRLTMT